MVKKEDLVYLFIGEDSFSKDIKIKRLKEEFLSKKTEHFNLDILYAKELTLFTLQERLLSLPIKSKKRIIIIKDIQNLKEDVKEFILGYVKKPEDRILLILDINKSSPRDDFVRQLIRHAQTHRFKESFNLDTFTLSRSIDFKKTAHALWVLSQLLKNGEKPERILGGLRYSWENSVIHSLETRRKLKVLLNCDIDIKTGRLKPDFALERLVVNLCSLVKSSG
jgi:DNA polymerase III delta subunit